MALMQTFYPGTYFMEKKFSNGARPITGINMSLGGCIGYFKQGPVGVPVLVNASNWENTFGGPIDNGYGWYVLSGFFRNNPSAQCWVTRTVHYSDITDPNSVTLHNGGAMAMGKVGTPSENKMLFKVNTIDGISSDDLEIRIYYEDDYEVPTLVRVDITEDVPAGSTDPVKVSSAYDFEPGVNVVIIDTSDGHVVDTNVVEEVLEISGDQAIKLKKPPAELYEAFFLMAIPGFEMDLYRISEDQYGDRDKDRIENHRYCSFDPNSKYYIEKKILEDSEYLTVEEYASTLFPDDPAAWTPIKYSDEYEDDHGHYLVFEGANDGLDGVTDIDLIGNKGAKTGIYAFDRVQDSFNIFCAESQSQSVTKALYEYCAGRMDVFAILGAPEGLDKTAMLEYIETAGFDTTYGALYHCWGNVDDPLGITPANGTAQKLVPLIGHVAGYYGRNDSNYDISQVPAGEDAVLYGVNSLEFDIDDFDNGELYKENVNCIRKLQGAGIVIWGGRLLNKDPDWKWIHSRRIFIYVEKSLLLSTRWVIFRPSNPSTWKTITRVVSSFMNTVPGLKGNSPKERYAVICDETTNPIEVQKAGQIICKVGLALNSVGEFLIFEVGQMDEGASLTEA